MMADLVRCPGCGGPGKTERDWRGDEHVVCDAYRPCTTERLPLEDLLRRIDERQRMIPLGGAE